MGLLDDWTLVRLETHKNGRVRMNSNSACCQRCGNAVAVPVVVWIARRLARIHTPQPSRGDLHRRAES